MVRANSLCLERTFCSSSGKTVLRGNSLFLERAGSSGKTVLIAKCLCLKRTVVYG